MTGGSLPDRTDLDPATGEVTGTPDRAGHRTFTLVVTDADGQSAQPGRVDRRGQRALDHLAGPARRRGRCPYAVTPTVNYGTGPFTWSVAGGSLPAGLTLIRARVRSPGRRPERVRPPSPWWSPTARDAPPTRWSR